MNRIVSSHTLANHHKKITPVSTLLLATAILIVVSLASLNLGMTRLSLAEWIDALLFRENWSNNLIVWEMRMPRLVLAIFIGASLSVSGVLLQGLSNNDLASPSTVGVNAGSGLGIMLALVFAPVFSIAQSWLIPLAAVGGALLVTAIVFGLATQRGSLHRGTLLPSRLLLVGIAIGYAANAAMVLLSLRMDFMTHNRVLAWMTGSINGADWSVIYWLVPCCLTLFALAFGQSQSLNVLALGDESSASLGLSIRFQRIAALLLATVITSLCSGVSGQIGFLGLAAPHLARKLVGSDHRILFPTAAICGALLLVAADSLGRHLFAPMEIPAGVLVGVLGGAYFLYLLARSKG